MSKQSSSESTHPQTLFPFKHDLLETFSSSHSPGVFEIPKTHAHFEDFKRDLRLLAQQINTDVKHLGCILIELWSCQVLPLNARDSICQLSFAFEQLPQYVDFSKFPLPVIHVLQVLLTPIEDSQWTPQVHMDNRCGDITLIYVLPYFEKILEILNSFHDRLFNSEREQKRVTLLRAQNEIKWTEEDEAMRLQAKRKRIEERRRKAEQGLRLAQLRVREEKYRMWFANQTIEVQQKLLRREAAQRKSKENKELRWEAVHDASFHNWNDEEFCSWLHQTLIDDLKIQFRVLKSSRRIGKMTNIFEYKRSATSMDVIQNCFHEVHKVLGHKFDEKVLRAAVGIEELLNSESVDSSNCNSSPENAEDSLVPMELKSFAELEPYFVFLGKLFATRLSYVHTCRVMCKRLRYAISYANIEASSEEITASFNAAQLRQRIRIIAIDILRETYTELTEGAKWIVDQLKISSSEQWILQARSWLATTILEKYLSEENNRNFGEALAAARICAGARGKAYSAFGATLIMRIRFPDKTSC